eukprot:UN10427
MMKIIDNALQKFKLFSGALPRPPAILKLKFVMLTNIYLAVLPALFDAQNSPRGFAPGPPMIFSENVNRDPLQDGI